MVKRITLEFSAPQSFPDLPVTPRKCVGNGHYLSDEERDALRMSVAILIHDKHNRYDKNAVAVLNTQGRQLGYISAAQGATYAPLIDHIGALKVPCTVERGNPGTVPILKLDLPKPAALKKQLGI